MNAFMKLLALAAMGAQRSAYACAPRKHTLASAVRVLRTAVGDCPSVT